MKTKITTLMGALLLTGCAHFQTTQTDLSYDKGKPQRTITTKASSYTFFDAKSDLSKFKATQSDKVQSASVGNLTSESSATNAVAMLNAVAQIISALPK